MSEKKNKLVREHSLSQQTAGEKVPVLPTEQDDGSFLLSRWTSSKKPQSLKIDNTILTTPTKTTEISPTDQVIDNTEFEDSPYTRIDDDLPSEIITASPEFLESKVILEDKMVQVPEDEEIIDENKRLPTFMTFPNGKNENRTFIISHGGGKGFNKPHPINLNLSEDQVVEIDCCKTYMEACCITFTCGIPILMKQRKAKEDSIMIIDDDDSDIVLPPATKHEWLKSCWIVFLLTATCGICGLIKDLRRQPPIKSEPSYEEVQPSSDDTPLIVIPPGHQPTLNCRKIANTLCLIATCGLSRLLRKSPEQPTTANKEEPDTNYTFIDEVKPPLLIEIVDEDNMPIVSFTNTQKEVLHGIAPTVYKSLSQYDPNDVSIKSTCSCCISCMDSCCQTCSCNLTSMFSRTKRTAPTMQKEDLFTPTLQKAGVEGGKMIQKIIFPLVLDVAREVWVALELVTIQIGFILSIATVSFDQNEIFNILHLILIIISSILAIVDAVYSLFECRSCKRCYNHIKGKDDKEMDKSTTDSTVKPCLRCMQWFNKKLDIPRIVISELLLYPLLVCDIFEVIVGRGYEGNSHSDRLGFALFLLSCISIFLYVYVVRALVLGRSIRRLHKIRSIEFRSNRPTEEARYFATNEALKYQVCFFIHIIFQMLAHIMMLVAIGGKIRYDNRHFYEPGNTDETIHYSGYLIIMLIIGYIAPTLGYLSFFLVTKTWAKQFPIGVFNDMMGQLKLLQQGGPENFLSDKDELNEKDEEKLNKGFEESPVEKMSAKQKLDRVQQFLAQFSHDYKNLRDMTFGKKLEYPFRNPMIVILSILYAAMQLTFIVCAGVAVDEMGVVVSQILNGGGWVVYYVIAIIIGAIANAYVFLVAGFWVLIVALAIAIIIAILACIVLVLIMASCGGSRRND